MNIFQRATTASSPITIRIASPDEIRARTKGELRDWRFFADKTGEGIKWGPFDENIFGKEGVLVCRCKRPPKGSTVYRRCPECGSLVRPARAERFGRIELVAKVAHPWFYLQNPNYIALALGDPTALERPAELSSTRQRAQSRFEHVLAGRLQVVIKRGSHANLHVGQILKPEEADELLRGAQSGSGFESDTGGDAIHLALTKLNLAEELRRSEGLLAGKPGDQRKWWEDRIALLRGFIAANIRPEWMMLAVLPVAPVGLRNGRPPQPVPPDKRTLRDPSQIQDDITDVEKRIARLKRSQRKEIAGLEGRVTQLNKELELTGSLRSLTLVDPINELYREVIRTNEALRDAKEARAVRDRVQLLATKLQWCVNRLLGPHTHSLKAEYEELFPPEKVDVEWQITQKQNEAADQRSEEEEQRGQNEEQPDQEEQSTIDETIDYEDLVRDAQKERANRQQVSNPEIPSISDRLAGKVGRFRGNLLAKRVDFSARSVIVTEPELRLHQCGLPREIAVPLYWPFILAELRQSGKMRAWMALQRQLGNLKGCLPGESVCLTPGETDEDPPEPTGPQTRQVFSYLKFFKDSQQSAPSRHLDSLTLDALDAVVARRPMVLVNRQPTLHRPSIQAFEVRLMDGETIRLHPLVCAGFNADFDGDTVAVHLPISDRAQQEARDLMMTRVNLLKPASGELLVTPSQDMVLGCHYLTLEPAAKPERPDLLPLRTQQEVLYLHDCGALKVHAWVRFSRNCGGKPFTTTVGRVLFNELLPAGTEFINEPVTKGSLRSLLEGFHQHHGPATLVEVVERVMRCGFTAATKAGISLAVDDLVAPAEKISLVEETVLKVENLEEEMRQEREELKSKQEKSDVEANASTSSRRMDKRIANLWLECMEQLKTNMKETLRRDVRHGRPNSLSLMLDSGARGSAEQIVQLVGMRGLMVRQDNSFVRPAIRSNLREGLSMAEFFTSTVGGRKGLIDSSKRTADAGYLTRKLAHLMCDVVVTELDCGVTGGLQPPSTPQQPPSPEQAESSVLWCQTKHGVCAKCYGIRLHDSQPARLGDAVGLIAAQSLGEPTTQLTLRTFHQGGSASGAAATGAEDGQHQDITSAVGKLTDLLSKLTPELESWATQCYVTVPDKPTSSHICITRERCVEGMAKLVNAVQAVYTDNNVAIHSKHVELVVREIFSKVKISEAGDTRLVSGSTITRVAFDKANDRMTTLGLRPAIGRLVVQGINNIKRHSGKLLVAASFSHAVKHLAAAAVKGQAEHFATIREKVMIGGLIPAGTGFQG